MKYEKDMFLESPSGFMMPFVATKDDHITISLGYGDQSHPKSGEKFFHSGYDFVADHVTLYAMATGVVTGLGHHPVHEQFIVCRYGEYDVKYGHIQQPYVQYGHRIQAGQPVAMSGDFLHFDVSYKGELLDPKVFIDLIYGNIQQLSAMGMSSLPQGESIRPVTSYDGIQNEVVDMMLRYWPSYMDALRTGRYHSPARLEQEMRSVFANASRNGHFFEVMPNIGNPLGLGASSTSLVSQVQELMLSDFLSYMALNHGQYPPSWNEQQKKNYLNKWQLTVSSATP